jgi:hypothetical protein
VLSFIKRGDQSEAVAAELQALEQRKRDLQAQRDLATRMATLAAQDLSELEMKIATAL